MSTELDLGKLFSGYNESEKETRRWIYAMAHAASVKFLKDQRLLRWSLYYKESDKAVPGIIDVFPNDEVPDGWLPTGVEIKLDWDQGTVKQHIYNQAQRLPILPVKK